MSPGRPATEDPRGVDRRTAIERGLAVLTQDDDFAAMAEAHPQLVVERI